MAGMSIAQTVQIAVIRADMLLESIARHFPLALFILLVIVLVVIAKGD